MSCVEVCYGDSSERSSSAGASASSSSSPPPEPRFKPRVLDCLPADAIPASQYRAYTECTQNPFNGWNTNPCPLQPRYPCPPPQGGSGKLDIAVPINPMTGVIGVNSGLTNGYVMTKSRRRNETITFEWETFKGQIGAKNINYVTMNATIMNLPSFDVQVNIRTLVNGTHYAGYFYLDPNSQAEKYQFHFDIKDNLSVNVGDSLTIYGGSATWISSC